VVIAAGLRDGGPHRGRESWQPQQPVPVPPRDQQPRAAVDLPAVVGAGERLRTTVGEHEVPDAHPADARRDDILQVALDDEALVLERLAVHRIDRGRERATVGDHLLAAAADTLGLLEAYRS